MMQPVCEYGFALLPLCRAHGKGCALLHLLLLLESWWRESRGKRGKAREQLH